MIFQQQFVLGQQEVSPPVSIVARRYWRIFITANNGNANFTSIAEMEMRLTAGGATQCVGGTAAASSSYFNDNGSRAFNGSTLALNNTWVTTLNTAPPHWCRYDFGSGVTKQIQEVAIFPEDGALNRAPRDFDIQSSDDASTWETVKSFTGITGWTAAWRTFSLL